MQNADGRGVIYTFKQGILQSASPSHGERIYPSVHPCHGLRTVAIGARMHGLRRDKSQTKMTKQYCGCGVLVGFSSNGFNGDTESALSATLVQAVTPVSVRTLWFYHMRMRRIQVILCIDNSMQPDVSTWKYGSRLFHPHFAFILRALPNHQHSNFLSVSPRTSCKNVDSRCRQQRVTDPSATSGCVW